MTHTRTKIATAVAAAALGATGLGLVGTSPAGATTGATTGAATSPSTSGPGCDRTPWEAKVQGYPKGFGAGSPSGDYLWHTSTGFHLRVTHADAEQRVYSGTIHASARMRMEPVRLEPGDAAKLSADHRTITFVFANHGYVDGVDFHTDCASTLTVSRLHVGNDNLGRDRVDLGATGAHPGQVPFTVHRIPIPAG